jgi:predicted Zn-dependent protease
VTGRETDVTDHYALVRRVELLLERRRFDQARPMIGEGLRANPDSVELLYFSAFIDWVHDRNDDAQATVGRILSLDPENYAARILRGQILQESRKFADAEQTWIHLLRDYPEDADVYGHYGALMLGTLNIDKARRLAAEGLRHEPEHEHCLFLAAMCDLIDGRSLGDNEKIATLVRSHPEHQRTSLTLILALEDQGDDRQALRVAQELLRSQPDSTQFVDLVRHFKLKTHWSMLPLYPVQRWGWTASIVMWAAVAFGLPLIAPGLPKGVAGTILVIWLVYVLYSWFWPTILKRIV